MLTRYCEEEIVKDGFSFFKDAYNTLGELIIRENEWSDDVGGRFRAPVRPIEDYIQYINENQIQAADVYMSNISFLKQCPSLKRLAIFPPVGFEGEIDYTPLYSLSSVEGLICGEEEFCEIDFSKISGLVYLSFSVKKGMSVYKMMSFPLNSGGFHVLQSV